LQCVKISTASVGNSEPCLFISHLVIPILWDSIDIRYKHYSIFCYKLCCKLSLLINSFKLFWLVILKLTIEIMKTWIIPVTQVTILKQYVNRKWSVLNMFACTDCITRVSVSDQIRDLFDFSFKVTKVAL